MMTTLAAGAFSVEDVTRLLMAFGLLLGAARLLGELARALGQPAVLGEILAGVLLGKTLLGAVAPGFYAWAFPDSGGVSYALEGFFVLSAVLLLLVAGLEVDLATVAKQGKAMLLVSLFGMVLPFVMGFGLAYIKGEGLGMGEAALNEPLAFQIFFGLALSITALPVIAKILLDLNMAKSDLGAVIMSSAMVNDLLGWIGFALVLSMIASGAADAGAEGGSGPSVTMTIVLTIGFVAVMLSIGRLAAHKTLPWVQAKMSWPGGTIGFVFVTAIFCAAFTEWLGVHSIFGAFIAGVALGDSHHLRARTKETIEHFITYVFAPLFFASIGLRVDFVANFDFSLVLIVCVVAIVCKAVGCWAGAKLAGMAPRVAWAVGSGMVARGAMEIILAQLAFEAGLINDRLLIAIVVMALVTSLIPGPAMQWLLKPAKTRRLPAVLSDKGFIAELQARETQSCITELAQKAADITNLSANTIANLVWEREQIIPTGLEHGIAVPHARLDGLTKPVVVVGLSEAGIDFDAPDGEPARIITLLLTAPDRPDEQIELLSMVAQAFAEEEARVLAVSADNYTEFLAAISARPDADAHG